MELNRKKIVAFVGALLMLSAFDLIAVTYAIYHSDRRDRGSDVLNRDRLLMRDKELPGKDLDEFLRVRMLVDNIQARMGRMLRQRQQIALMQLLFTGAALYYAVRNQDKKEGKKEGVIS